MAGWLDAYKHTDQDYVGVKHSAIVTYYFSTL